MHGIIMIHPYLKRHATEIRRHVEYYIFVISVGMISLGLSFSGLSFRDTQRV